MEQAKSRLCKFHGDSASTSSTLVAIGKLRMTRRSHVYGYVFYTCVENDNSPECAGTNKEWEMVYGTNGQNMTPSLPRHGKVRARELTRIYRRRDLKSVIEQPFQLQGIKY